MKEKKKTSMLLNSILFWGLQLFCGAKRFPGMTVHLSRGFSGVTEVIFSRLWIWGSAMCVCVQTICLAECYAQETQLAGKARGLCKHECPDWLYREKKRYVRSVEVCLGNWERVSLLHQQASLFRHSYQKLPGRLLFLYLFIYLFYFAFYLCFMLLLFLNW